MLLDPTTIVDLRRFAGSQSLIPRSWYGARIAFATVAIFATRAEFNRSAEGVLRLPNRAASDRGALLTDACRDVIR